MVQIVTSKKKQSKIKLLFSGFFNDWTEKLLAGLVVTSITILILITLVFLLADHWKILLLAISIIVISYIAGHFILKWR